MGPFEIGILFGVTVIPVSVGLWARAWGRSAIGYAVLSVVFSPAAILLLLLQGRRRSTGNAPSVAHPAGWLPDPSGRYQHRYFDGYDWTGHVGSHGRSDWDPLTNPTPPGP